MSNIRAEVNELFHGYVGIGYGVTADYVVAHAARQQSKGKRPSVAYRGIANPNLAVEQARQDIVTRTEDNGENDYYRRAFSGRVAIMHAGSEAFQLQCAGEYVYARMEDGGCIGAIILGDLNKIDIIDPIQVNTDGTAEVPYIFG